MKKSSLYTNVRANQVKIAIFMLGFLLISIPGITEAKLISVGTDTDTVNFGNNVGIGTTAPTSKLSVKGDMAVEGTATTSNAILNFTTPYYGRLNYSITPINGKSEARFVSKGATAGAGQTYFVIASTEAADTGNNLLLGVAGTRAFIANATNYSTAGTLHLGGTSWGANGVVQISGLPTDTTGLMSVMGNVGIGTTVPEEKLQVSGVLALTRAAASSFITGATIYDSRLYSTNNNGATYPFLTMGNLVIQPRVSGAGYDIIFATHNGTSVDSRMVIKDSGNVGIGATNPTAKLYVAGTSLNTLATTHSLLGGTGNVLVMADNTGALYATSTAGFSGGINFWGGTKNETIWNGDAGAGNVAIGTTTAPQNKLVVVTNQSGGGVIKVQNTNIASWSSFEMFDYLGVHKANFGYANPNAPTVAGLAHFSTSDDTPFIIAIHDLEKIRFTTEGYIGINQTDPSRPLHISSTSTDLAAAGNNNSMVFINGLMNSISRQQSGIVSSPWINPPSASTQTYIGLNFIPNSDSPYVSGAKIMGLYGGAYYHGTSTLGQAYGGIFKNFAEDTSTITTSYGVYIDNAYKAAGATITNNYGLYINDQTAGTNDYSIYSQGGTNYFGGNVGIGTTTTGAKLEIAGAIRNSLATTHSLLGGAGNVLVMADNTGALYATSTAGFSGGVNFWGGTKNGDIWNGDAGAGNVGIGTTAPGNNKLVVAGGAMTVSGGYNAQAGAHISLSQEASYAQLQSWGSRPLYINPSGNNVIFNRDGGNVGIGTTTPTRKLTIAQGTTATSDAFMSFNNSTERWLIGNNGTGMGASNDNSFVVYSGAGYALAINPNEGMSVGAYTASTPPAEGMIIPGNVGIGTTTPTSKLQVASDGAGNSSLQISSDTWATWLRTTAGTNAGGLYLAPISRIVSLYDGTNAYNLDIFNGATRNVRLAANGDSYLNGGNIGIGTTAPGAKLSIVSAVTASTIQATVSGTSNDPDILIARGSGANDKFRFRVRGGSGSSWLSIWDETNGTIDQGLIIKGGNIGIGSTTIAAKLDVSGTVKLGTAGSAITAMGDCTIASTAISTTKTNYTCTGVPASTAVVVTCSGSAAQSGTGTLYCRATGTADQVACNTSANNTTAMTWTCMWLQP